MEYINIVKKLHEVFPEFDVETVIKILEVIKSEEPTLSKQGNLRTI